MASARVLLLAAASFVAAGCASGASVTRPTAASAAEGAPREELAWAPLSAETFARAKREGKLVILDGSAAWCHWCHVMEATTYHDPAVRALLDRHFVAVKVDVDARPDLEERYGDWGWPATVVFSADATELAKYRGYIEPARFAELLRGLAEGARTGMAEAPLELGDARRPIGEEALAFVERWVTAELADYYDEDEGGWGRTQKAPLGGNNAWLLSRARADARAREAALFTLDKQSKLVDPVWGGIYQYSAARDWDHPHFEKLMTFQAPALENYAEAWALTRDPRHLARARAMHGYMERFLRSPEGGFYATQDADVNAHDRSRPFTSGHDYYALPEAARLARGVPRIDTHVYARESGLGIAAYVVYARATGDGATLASAARGASHVLATHRAPGGGLAHDARPDAKVLYAADSAAMAMAYARLHEATGERAHLDQAVELAGFLEAAMVDPASGALFSSTEDPDAAGVLARRRVAFEDNVLALRAYARIARATGDPRWPTAIRRILTGISTPAQIKARGRWLGDYLLALEETKGVR